MSEVYTAVNNGEEPDYLDLGSYGTDIDEVLDQYLEKLFDYDFTSNRTDIDEFFNSEVGAAYQHFLVTESYLSEDGEEKTRSIGQLTDRVVEAAQLWRALNLEMTEGQKENFPEDPIVLYTKIIDEAGDIHFGSRNVEELYSMAKDIDI